MLIILFHEATCLRFVLRHEKSPMQKVLRQFFFVTIHVLSVFTHYSYEVHPITTMNYTFSIFTPKPKCHEQISLNPCEYEYNPKPFVHLKLIQLNVFRNLKPHLKP